MVTNFEHMKKWNVMYKKLTFYENSLLLDESTESYTQFIGGARMVLDIMLKELVKEANLTDQNIISVKQGMATGCKQNQEVDLFGRILALEKLNIISKNSAENMHFIRKNGNKAVHGEENFVGMSESRLAKLAEEVYEKLYFESYLFAKEYIPELQSKAAVKKNTANDSKPKGAMATFRRWFGL